MVAPRFQRLELIAEVLGCTVSELFVCKNEEVAAKISVIEDVLLRLPQDVRSEVLQVILNLLYSFQKLLPVCSMQAEKESQRAEQNRVMVGKHRLPEKCGYIPSWASIASMADWETPFLSGPLRAS